MDKVDVKFGEWIQRGFDLYKANAATLILVNLLAMVLGVLTIGILGGPMFAGVIMVTLALLDKKEPKPEVGDVFKGFEYFLQMFLLFIVWMAASFVGQVLLNFIPVLGYPLSMLYVYSITTCAMFAPFHIVERRMDFVPALQASFDMVKTNFWPFFGLLLIASILSHLGFIACCIGIVVTMPIYTCIMAVAYREAYGSQAAQPEPAPAPAG
ncbi:MAG: hypothetical protein V1929_08140 [bacterium]